MPDGETGWAGRLGPRWVGVLLNALAVGSAGGAFLLSALAGAATGARRTGLLVTGALLAAGVVAFGALRQLRDARRLRSAEELAVAAQEELGTALNGALGPITSYLGELVDAPDAETQATIAGQLRQAAVDAAVRLTAPGSRSAFYRLAPAGDRLTREVYAGRAALPRPEFRTGTRDGDAVLDLVARGDLVFVEDVATDPMVRPTVPGSYRTVIAAAVTAGERRLGMLTVDAPQPGDLSRTDVELVRVLANLLGSGLAQAE